MVYSKARVKSSQFDPVHTIYTNSRTGVFRLSKCTNVTQYDLGLQT